MPLCPKCLKEVEVTVLMSVTGFLRKGQAIDSYPELEHESSSPHNDAWCMECDHEAPLKDFYQQPTSGDGKGQWTEETL